MKNTFLLLLFTALAALANGQATIINKNSQINWKASVLIIISFSLSTLLWADPPPPPPPGGGHGQTNNQTGGGAAPIGSGIMMLVVTASVYGAWRSWKPRQEDII